MPEDMLNSFAWNEVVVSLLGDDYLAMVRFLLCDPECGLNIRNEAAHANAAPHLYTAGRVLLIALAIVRLTLLAGSGTNQAEANEDTDSDADADAG